MANNMDISEKPHNWESHFKSTDYNLKSYEIMVSLLEQDNENLNAKFDEFISESPQDQKLRIEQKLIECLYYENSNNSEKFFESVRSVENLIKDMTGFNHDMYRAILD